MRSAWHSTSYLLYDGHPGVSGKWHALSSVWWSCMVYTCTQLSPCKPIHSKIVNSIAFPEPAESLRRKEKQLLNLRGTPSPCSTVKALLSIQEKSSLKQLEFQCIQYSKKNRSRRSSSISRVNAAEEKYFRFIFWRNSLRNVYVV